jgi:hypothetical protein
VKKLEREMLATQQQMEEAKNKGAGVDSEQMKALQAQFKKQKDQFSLAL